MRRCVCGQYPDVCRRYGHAGIYAAVAEDGSTLGDYLAQEENQGGSRMLHFNDYVEERQNTATLHIGESLSLQGEDVFDIQIQVHVDSSYPTQSWAKVEVWDEATISWHEVSKLIQVPCESFRTKRDAAFEAADELRARAAALLLHEEA